ncbi:MAG: VOC family protein [Clostridia bacterium]|nr:VOC family protein [Clostridia bacterium]
MEIGIEHIAIFAKDTKKLTDWYKNLFDCKTVYENGKGTYFLAFSDKSMIEFCTCEEHNISAELSAPGIRHIALSVNEEDFKVLEEKIKNSETEILKPAQINDKGVGTMFFRDIEGNILHLMLRKTPLI